MASFRKLKAGWQYRIRPVQPDGTLGNISEKGFRTKSEAVAAANKMQAKLDAAIGTADLNVAFADYFDDWVKRYKDDKVSKVTMDWYIMASKWIHVYFKKTQLSKITRADYQDYLNWLAEDQTYMGVVNGKTKERPKRAFAHTTIQKLNSYTVTMLDDAIYDGIVPRKFTHRVSIGGVAGQAEEDKFLSYNEFTKLTEYALEHASVIAMSHYMVYVQAYTGLRYEELLGLTWADIDFDHATLRVDHTWDYKSKPRKVFDGFADTKNYPSRRTISIPDKLVGVLRELRTKQREVFVKRGFRDPDDLVFRNAYGEWIGNKGMNDVLKADCKAVGARQITSHGLRHTHGSILLYQGVNIMSVSRRLGHGTLQTTMKVYLHVVRDLEARDEEKITNILQAL